MHVGLLLPTLVVTHAALVRPSPSRVAELVEPAAIAAVAHLRSRKLTLPADVALAPVEVSFLSTGIEPQEGVPPIVLLHSFDSSCLEFRRVMPLLAKQNLEAYALDMLGWGFCDTRDCTSIGVKAKRAELAAFWEEVLGKRPMILLGSSLGAASVIDFCASAEAEERVGSISACMLLDPQVLIEGTPPVPAGPLARGGVRLLKSWALRSLGQKIAYEDVQRCDTDDAIRVGRLHCERAEWEDDAVRWLLGGGYSVASSLAPLARSPPWKRCVVLWGRQDRVLPPKENVPRLRGLLGRSAEFHWVGTCGHVPHLEQPAAVADAIGAVVRGEAVRGSGLESMALEDMAAAGAAGTAPQAREGDDTRLQLQGTLGWLNGSARRRALVFGGASVLAATTNLFGATSALLSLAPGVARQLRLDTIYPVRGFKRSIDPDGGRFTFLYSARLLVERRDYQRDRRAKGLPVPLTPGLPVVAFGDGPPRGFSFGGEENVALVVGSFKESRRGTLRDAYPDAQAAADYLLKRTVYRDSRRSAALVDAHAALTPSGATVYVIEYTVDATAAGYGRTHHLCALGVANLETLVTLAYRVPAGRWPEREPDARAVVASFDVLA